MRNQAQIEHKKSQTMLSAADCSLSIPINLVHVPEIVKGNAIVVRDALL